MPKIIKSDERITNFRKITKSIREVIGRKRIRSDVTSFLEI